MSTIAERRMFSKRVINSARFVRMPPSTRALYVQLGVNADDDGIVEAYTIMRQIGATEDDLHVLVARQFATVLNDDLVTYLNDWPENNSIRADRKIDSIYKPLLLKVFPEAQLVEPKDRSDTKKPRQQPDSSPIENLDGPRTVHGQPMDRIGKVRLGKDSKGKDKTNSPAKAEPPINYANVFEYLNKKSGKHFRDTETNRKLIKARLDEGFTPQDVKTAINNVCAGWLGTEMARYIQPSTIFRASKFEGYVNSVPGAPNQFQGGTHRNEPVPDWLAQGHDRPVDPQTVSADTQAEIDAGLAELAALHAARGKTT